MADSRKSEHARGNQAGEQEHNPAAPTEIKSTNTGKTLQELERVQFDALDRAGFDR